MSYKPSFENAGAQRFARWQSVPIASATDQRLAIAAPVSAATGVGMPRINRAGAAAAGAAALLSLVLALTGCASSTPRSTDAVCEKIESWQPIFSIQMSAALAAAGSSDVTAGDVTTVDLDQAKQMWEELTAVWPTTGSSDAAAVSEALANSGDFAEVDWNAVGATGMGLPASLNSIRAYVNDWCGADLAATSEEPAPETSASEAPAAQGIGGLNQVFSLTDRDGYTFDLKVDFSLLSIDADPSTQPPGMTAAVPEIALGMAVTNTTPQRELSFKGQNGVISPLDLPTFFLFAHFNAGSPVCTTVMETDKGCDWVMGFGRMESGTTLAADASATLSTYAGIPNGGEEFRLLQGIPESSWEQIRASLLAPDGYRIVYPADDQERFTSVCETGPGEGAVIVQTVACS